MLDIVSKNVSQSEADRNIILNIIVTPHVFYTCPADKRARVKGWVRCVDRGGSADASFEAAGISLFTWDSNVSQITVQRNANRTPQQLSTFGGGMIAPIDVILEAGQTIRAIQSGGFTNAQFKINAKVRELPA